MSKLGLESGNLGCQLGDVFFSGHGEVIALRVSRLKLSSTVRVHSETRNVLHPSTHGALMYLQNRHSRG